MPRVEFEPTIPVFERAKTVHALDRAATMIGTNKLWSMLMSNLAHCLRVYVTECNDGGKIYNSSLCRNESRETCSSVEET
jgi:hypothetical protein